jgi:ElaB/YqjD/DUF883 family membrane-anchored ribosome-binding protein
MDMQSRAARLMDKKDDVATSLRDLASGAEDLLRSTASYTGDEIEVARKRLKRQLEAARDIGDDWTQNAKERYRQASALTDEYVHENAWKSIGVAVLLGLALGACLMAGNGRR